MGHAIDEQPSIGRMNVDAEARNLPKGDYRYALCLRNGAAYINLEGVSTNVKGNTLVPTYICPYNGGGFPDGINETIGSYEDTINNTVIFFNFNSNNKHAIYRWYIDKSDVNNPYGTVEQIIQFDFGWVRTERITSINFIESSTGSLVYWIDSQGLHQINIDKANICNKQKSWNIYLPQTNLFTVPHSPRLTFRDFNNNLITSVITILGTYDSNALALEAWATALNNNSAFNTKYTATSCACHLTITELITNTFHYICDEQVGNFPNLFVPDNWYGDSLTPRMFDRVFLPPLNTPVLEYKQDTQYIFNNVKNHVFQGRIQYISDIFQESVWGIISQIPINNLQCDGTNNPLLNYIDVNFNDDQIAIAETLVTLKKISVAMRELNSGSWREVLTLEPCDFLDYDLVNNVWFCHYKFYNDITPTTIATADADKLESGVPINALAEINYFNRITEGAVELGRNSPECADATVQVKIGDSPNQDLYEATVIVRIYNLTADGSAIDPNSNILPNELQSKGAIFEKDSTKPVGQQYVWGGIPAISTSTSDLRQDINQQYLPEGGFVGYLAGTDFIGISTQIQSETISGVVQNGNYLSTVTPNGVIDASGAALTGVDKIKNFLTQYQNPPITPSDIYQLITIRNVPKGKYIFRLASHWCSIGDKLQKGADYDITVGRGYQKTSTNTYCVNVFANGAYTGLQPNEYEIPFEITNADVFIGDVYVRDNIFIKSPDTIAVPAFSISGYLYDADGSADQSNLNNFGITMEKQMISAYANHYNVAGIIFRNLFATIPTDHNGYFFLWLRTDIVIDVFPRDSGLGIKAFAIDSAGGEALFTDTDDSYYIDSTNNSVLKALSTTSLGSQSIRNLPYVAETDGCSQILVPNRKATLTNSYKTFITGKVLSPAAMGEPSVLVVYWHTGRYEYTQADGSYSIAVWSDSKDAYYITGHGQKRTGDFIIFNVGICPASLSFNQLQLDIDPFGINPAISPPYVIPYSPTAKFLVATIILTHLMNLIGKAPKRGGKYLIGGRENDPQGRLCSVYELKELYIPFETEDLGKFPYVVDDTGTPYPLGTYKGGKATIIVTLNYVPQQYTSNLQIMFTPNMIYGRYLQWVANEVVYLSQVATATTPEIQTSFQNGDATAVRISVLNLIAYNASNPNNDINVPTVGYTYQAGDHVRIIYSRNLQLVQGLLDFEAIGYDQTTQSIIIKITSTAQEIQSGALFEVYNAKSTASANEQIYWESGNEIACTAPGTSGNQFAQTIITITGGDTYWRGRTIPVNDDLTNFAASYPVIIEDASVSDFYPSLASDIGRPGIVDENLTQIFYPSRLLVSDLFQPDTALNGLGSFSALNTKDLGKNFGEIVRIIMVGKTMHAITKNNNVSNYIGVVTLRYSQSTQGVQAISDDFLGTENPSLSNIGTEHPASVATIDGYIYGMMDLRKNVWRYAQDGMAEISRNEYQDANGLPRTRMLNYFKDLCSTGIWDAASVFDKRYRQYILTAWKQASAYGTVTDIIIHSGSSDTMVLSLDGLATLSPDDVIEVIFPATTVFMRISGVQVIDIKTILSLDIPEGLDISIGTKATIHYKGEGKTIAWNEDKNGWDTEYPFLPECYGTLGDQVVAFKDGKLWVQDTNETRNNFFGEQFTTKVTPVFNDKPSWMKVFNSCILETNQADGNNNWEAVNITNDNGQRSKLPKGIWKKIRENWFAPFLRDENDLTKPPLQRLSQGKPLIGSSLTVELENDTTVDMRLRYWDANWTANERTTK